MAHFVIFGNPVRHSVSPAMHSAAFAHLHLPHEYTPLALSNDLLPQAVSLLRAGKWQGANVTIPHKQAIIPYLDELTPAAKAMSAVNTLFWQGNRLMGDNTDAPGFLADLKAHHLLKPASTALIFGIGGSARAVVHSLLQHDYHIRIMARSLDKAQAFCQSFNGFTERIQVFEYTPTHLSQAAEGCGLVVNCTPLGMTPEIDTSAWFDEVPFPSTPDMLPAVYDLVYNPLETRLMRQARENGLVAVNGLGMLVQQGALAFQRWTGILPPTTIMETAALQKLQGK
ncbi:MAG TPA: shikimate dehydrogenase [Anaerolineales bacterium]|nr:shikimate dehydrogenase [Anaerolineales bacterium]